MIVADISNARRYLSASVQTNTTPRDSIFDAGSAAQEVQRYESLGGGSLVETDLDVLSIGLIFSFQ